ncbi:redoxin domain-containing protein [Singulisphaera acidiphila]|uniref:AhpC/TSA family protein n=1 Tax=Singulisphaera acidiphila (strain ATCC BAA-1392 / DSM 18658 / VKM B-2454 / MOB10) TaxID=886293 RepID=L0D5H4_SINAD|nr:redoxin domain-containing protein [Singulisphaera acidiphila]AGA24679.1 AhpC/TSA family protein [Singulisphaera acidiphila DSM 18658]
MSLPRLTACGLLALMAGALAAWWANAPADWEHLQVTEPPFLKQGVVTRSLDGEKLDFQAPVAGVAVVLFYSRECPLPAESLTTLARLATDFPANRLFLAGVCVDPVAARETIEKDKQEHKIVLPTIAHDRDGSIVRQFGVKRVPEVFVLDDAGRLRYRGRINGQPPTPGDGEHEPGTAHSGVRSAIEAVLSDRPVPAIYLEPVGCPPPERPRIQEDIIAPTYHRDVAPILQHSCQPCHQPGQSGPFSLTTYTQAAKRAGDLAAVTEQRLMPPWKPVPGIGPPLKHDRTLLASEIKTLQTWAAAGAPEGQPETDEPPPASIPTPEWSLGPPDLVVAMDQPFRVPASGDDLYRCFVMPTALPQDRFLTAIEVKPGNPRVVHHTFGYVDTRGLGRQRDADDPMPGYPCFSGFTGDQIFGLLGGWTPGNDAHPFGAGIGLELPRNADVVMQVHYHPSGKAESDCTRLGLYLSKTPVRQALEWVSACPDVGKFRLPADDPTIQVVANLNVPIPVALHAMTPHMHWLGRRFRATVLLPGGRIQPLIAIDDWDFNRQDTYYLREPLSIPAGSIIQIEGLYDNSSRNPHNPNQPPQDVLWGEATTDDMLILFLALTQDGQDLTRPGARNTFMEEFFQGKPPAVQSKERPSAR